MKVLKYFLLLLLVVIAVTVFYFFKQQSAKVAKIENRLPENAKVVIKFDPSRHKVQLFKELMNGHPIQEIPEDPFFQFLLDLGVHHGAGVSFLSPVYFYKNEENWGVLLGMQNSNTFKKFIETTKTANLVNDTLGVIPESRWSITWDKDILQLFVGASTSNSKTPFSTTFSQFYTDQSLINGVIRDAELRDIYFNLNPINGSWELDGILPNNNKGAVINAKKFRKDSSSLVDLYISHPQFLRLEKSIQKIPILNDVITQIELPIHIQYIGKGERMEKIITYEYNDDFEMEEVVKMNKTSVEKVKLAINLEDHNQGVLLRKLLQIKASFLFPEIEIMDNVLVCSFKEISKDNLENASNLVMSASVKASDELLPWIQKTPLFTWDQFPVQTLESNITEHTDSTLVLKTIIKPIDEFKGIRGALKAVGELGVIK